MSRIGLHVAAAAVLVTVVGALGIGVPATSGAQASGDEPQYLLTALSLWEDGNLDISDEIEAGRYRPFHQVDLDRQTRALEDGRRVSPHDPLLPLLLAGPMGLGGWVWAKAAIAVLAGATAGLLTWVAVRRFDSPPAVAALIVSLFFLSPPLAVYATQVYPEVPAALATTAAIAALGGARPYLGRGGSWALGAAVVALPWLGVKFVPLAAVLALFGLLRLEPGRRRGFAGALALAGAAYVAAHLWFYGGFTSYATGDHFVTGEWTVVGSAPDMLGRSTRLLGLLADRGFGLAPWQPLYLLAVPAAAWIAARRRPGHRLLIAVVGTGWLVATFPAATMHGWWFPGRQLVAVLPALVLIVVDWARGEGRRLHLIGAVGGIGVVAFAHLVFEGWAGGLNWVVDFGATSNVFYRTIASIAPDYRFVSGETWVLHGLWLATTSLLFFLGWRSARGITSVPAPSRGRTTDDKETILR